MKMRVRIASDIPIPPMRKPSGRGKPYRGFQFPWLEMKIGDSFEMLGTYGMHRNIVSRRTTEASYRTGFKFTIRRQPSGYYRIWRYA